MTIDPPASENGSQLNSTLAVAKVLSTERVVRTIVRTVGVVACVYFGIAVPVQATAGQETALLIAYQALVGLNAHVTLSYGATVVFFLLWRRERRLRIDAVRRENRRNEQLEKRLDPNRSSSGFKE